MHLQPASRKNAKIKMALQGPSGSGKTFGALQVACGLCPHWQQIAVIDTENHSAELYAHLGEYQVLHLPPPFSPERYIQALQLCEQEGMEVIILDSISHEWEGIGGILELHGNMAGNSYTNWAKLTPRHTAFVQHMLQSPAHIIATIRSKQEYVLTDKNGRHVPEKVGLKGVTREGMDYEFTLVLELDIKHQALATKDRTSLFAGRPEMRLSPDTGRQLLDWCRQGITGTPPLPPAELSRRIQGCRSLDELLRLYYAHPTTDTSLLGSFSEKRKQLVEQNPSPLTLKSGKNGTSHTTAGL